MHQFAWQSTFQEPWAEVYYQRKRKEGKPHSMAVRALANVWVRVMFARLPQAGTLLRCNVPGGPPRPHLPCGLTPASLWKR